VETLKHWTEESAEDYIYQIGSSFVRQLELFMGDTKQHELAAALNVTPGRVSQMFNNPGNATLKRCVEYARVLGLKVAVVAYNDGDKENARGPIDGQVFEQCWQRSGRPNDFFDMQEQPIQMFTIAPGGGYVPGEVRPVFVQANSITTAIGYSASAGTNTNTIRSAVGADNGANHPTGF
jgi:hypothetical protein